MEPPVLEGSRLSGRATAACIVIFPPARRSVRLKRSPSTKKDRSSSTRRFASVANTASTPVPGKSSPRTTSRAKPASAPCAATESAKTNNLSVFRPAPWTLSTSGLTEEIADKATKQAASVGGYLYGDKEAGGGSVVYVLKEKKKAYGVREVGQKKFPKHQIPLGLMLKDLFTPRCGIPGKLRALYLAIIHPKRLIYRYFS